MKNLYYEIVACPRTAKNKDKWHEILIFEYSNPHSISGDFMRVVTYANFGHAGISENWKRAEYILSLLNLDIKEI